MSKKWQGVAHFRGSGTVVWEGSCIKVNRGGPWSWEF